MTNAERQSVTREVNDHIRGRFGHSEDPATPLEVMCECGSCTSLGQLTLGEYDQLRPGGYLTIH